MHLKLTSCLLLFIAVLPLFAQEAGQTTGSPSGAEPAAPRTAEPQQHVSPFRSTVELQFYNFGNFFQAREGSGIPERSANALGVAYRGYWVRPNNTPDVYGGLSTLRYSGGASETSYAGHVGVAKYGSTYWYDVYVEHTRNGWSFDVAETRATANVTSMWTHYSYPVTPDWRLGVEGYFDWLDYDVEADLGSSYRSIGAVARYDGFGDYVQPRAGIMVGQRDAEDDDEDVDDRYWYLQLTSEPTPNFEISLRYRGRNMEYGAPGREEDRGTWFLRALFKQNDRMHWLATYRQEAINSSLPNSDFDRDIAYVGMQYKF